MRNIIFVVIVLFCSAAAGQNASDDTLLKELETAAATDQTKNETAFNTSYAREAVDEDPLQQSQLFSGISGNESNPSISLTLDMAGAYFSRHDRYRQGGHAPTQNGPSIQGAELSIAGAVDPFFSVNLAFGLWHLHVEEVYLTTTSLPWNLQLRAGQYKSNIGRHNPTHLHTWKFVTHPMANEFLFGAEGMGLPGVEFSWLSPLPWYLEVIGSLQMGSAGSFRTKSLSEGDPVFSDFLYPLRLVQYFDFSDAVGLQFGLNAVFGKSDQAPETGNRSYAYGTDLFLKWRPIGSGSTGYTFVAWTAEMWLRQMEVPGSVWNDIGLYNDIVFGMTKRWESAVRGEYWKTLSGSHVDVRSNYGVNLFKIGAVLSFMPSHFSRIRLQYSVDTIEPYPTGHSVLLQMEVSAGAHGAHQY